MMNVKLDPKDQKMIAELMGSDVKSEYRPEDHLWSAEQMQKVRTLLELAGRSERLQKALRASGYRGPFPRVD